MLNNAIEKNKRYLLFCSYVARSSGLLLLLLGFISLVQMLCNFYPTDRFSKYDVALVCKCISPYIFRFAFRGLFLLGISQLIKYLIDINFKPNWILKFSDKIIYLYVGLLIINFIFFSIYQKETVVANQHHFLATWIPSAIFTFVKALLWVGMAQVLRRVIPIIEEHKSLV